jgi:DNA repair protein RecO (recombination protein O)
MPAEKTAAVVLRVVDFSETSCVVTLYTEDWGKVSALAKGARRLRSPFEGALDVLSICRIVFLRKSVDTLDLLTEAKLERRFRSASTHLSRLYAAMYTIELTGALTDHADPQPAVYHNLAGTIQEIDEGGPTAIQVLRFELDLLRQLGHMPSLVECVECGRPVDEAAPTIAFGLLAGGVYCERCRLGKQSVVRLHRESLQWMRDTGGQQPGSQVARERTGEWPPPLSPASRGELRGMLDKYLSHLLGYRLRTTPWLRQVGSD